MNGIFIMDDHTEVYGVWHGRLDERIDILGMVYRQPGEPWRMTVRLARFEPGSNDAKDKDVNEVSDPSFQGLESATMLWAVLIQSIRTTCRVMKAHFWDFHPTIKKFEKGDGTVEDVARFLEALPGMETTRRTKNDLPQMVMTGPAAEA